MGFINFSSAWVNCESFSLFFSSFTSSFMSLARFGATCKALLWLRFCSPAFRLFKSLFVRLASFLSMSEICSSATLALEKRLFEPCSELVFSLFSLFLFLLISLSIIG